MNKGNKIKHTGITLLPDKSWGKEVMKFKVDKKNYRHDKERVRCSGAKCIEREKSKKGERNFAPKGEECEKCYSSSFEEFRVRPSSQTPYFDNEFLTRFTLV